MNKIEKPYKIKIDRIETGYICCLTVNTKGRGIPIYLIDYLGQVCFDTKLMFDVRTITDVSDYIPKWKEHGTDIEDSDTLAQIICTLNTDSNSENFKSYVTAYVEEDIIPFLSGCGFDIIGMLFTYRTPDKYRGIAIGGDKGVLLYMGGGNVYVFDELFESVFNMDRYAREKALAYLELAGQYKIDKTILMGVVPELENLLNLLSIKYEITD